jgi:DNA polymerase-3 subunit gamma/tau
LAKAINCLKPEAGEPCDRCRNCVAFNEGRFVDLVELDAASNRGIDEVRNIRDKVGFVPGEGRFKTYVLDEAHMLTEQAANAFLKTLEEPPRHIIFIMCTTEPHSMLPTILSRCQRFDFKRLTASDIVKRLMHICQHEGLEVENEVLKVVARVSGGSLRDAENLLEMLVVSRGPKPTLKDAMELLGLTHQQGAMELIRHILLGNAPNAMTTINRLLWEGTDTHQLHRQTLELLRGVLLIQAGSQESLELPEESIKELSALASKTPMLKVVHTLKVMGQVNLKHDPSPLPLELAIVEACTMESPQTRAPEPQRSQQSVPVRPKPFFRETSGQSNQAVSLNRPTVSGAQQASPVRRPVPSASPSRVEAPAGTPVIGSAPGQLSQSQWSAVLKSLSLYNGKRFNIGALLRDCKQTILSEDTLVLKFTHRSHMERFQQELEDPKCQHDITENLCRALGKSQGLKLSLEAENGNNNASTSTHSPLIRAAMNMGARIIEEKENGE